MPNDTELLPPTWTADNTFGRALMYNEKEFYTQSWIQVVCEKQGLGEIDVLPTSCWCFLLAIAKVLLAPLMHMIPLMLTYGIVAGNLQHINELIILIGPPCFCFISSANPHIILFTIAYCGCEMVFLKVVIDSDFPFKDVLLSCFYLLI